MSARQHAHADDWPCHDMCPAWRWNQVAKSARMPYQDIAIRETKNGPELVFDSGVQGFVIPLTEADMGKLEYVVVRRRRRQAWGMVRDRLGARAAGTRP